MKTSIIFRLLLIVLSVMSCQEADKEIRTNPYDAIGILHNQIMENSFYRLKELKDRTGKLDSYPVVEILQKTALETVLEQKNRSEGRKAGDNTESYNETEINFINSAIDSAGRTAHNIYQYYIYSNGQPFVDKAYSDALEYSRTKNEREYSLKIFSLFKDEKATLDETLKAYVNLEQEIMGTCTEQEQIGLLTSVAIAKHTAQYWSTNVVKWQSELGSEHSAARVQGGPNWRVVGGFDVAAAVLTGTLTSPALVVPFVGWGAYTAVVGGVTAIVSGTALWAFWSSEIAPADLDPDFDPEQNLFAMPNSPD